jgi:Protein of unknown function (DUF1566)
MRRALVIVLLLSASAAPAGGADRFTPAGDGAVRDAATGLIWELEPGRFHGTWMEAPAHCADKRVGGEAGWRVPSVQELKTLIDPDQHDPALPPGHPFIKVRSAIFWTATASDKDDIVAWHVSFLSGEAVTDQKSQTRRVWCVR